MFSCGLVDILLRLVMSVGTVLLDSLNGLWGVIDWGPAGQAFAWFLRLNDWLPITSFLMMLAIVVAVSVFMQALKWGKWLIGFLPGTGGGGT